MTEWDDDVDDQDTNDDGLAECPHCGAAIYDDSEKCPRCGEWINGAAVPGSRSKYTLVKIVAVVLIGWILWRWLRL